jgi:hypothetical protein
MSFLFVGTIFCLRASFRFLLAEDAYANGYSSRCQALGGRYSTLVKAHVGRANNSKAELSGLRTGEKINFPHSAQNRRPQFRLS